MRWAADWRQKLYRKSYSHMKRHEQRYLLIKHTQCNSFPLKLCSLLTSSEIFDYQLCIQSQAQLYGRQYTCLTIIWFQSIESFSFGQYFKRNWWITLKRNSVLANLWIILKRRHRLLLCTQLINTCLALSWHVYGRYFM